MTRTGRGMALLAALVLVAVTPLSAQAGKPYEHFTYEGTDSFDDEICGISAHFEVQFSGAGVTRPVKGSDGQAFYAHNSYRFSEEISTAAGTVYTSGHGVFHEQKATQIDGDVWEFEWLDAGRFTLRDASGQLLLRANGVLKASEQFDTLGDGMPGGVFVPDTFEVLAENGQPFNEDAFCDAVLRELT